MPAQYGTVVSFSPGSGCGFAQIDGTETTVLVHKNQKSRVVWTGPAPDDLGFQPDAPCTPNVGDELVLDTRQTSKGGKAVSWAFKREWTMARSAAPASRPVEPSAPRPEPASVPVVQRTDPPLAFGEMIETFDFRLLHAVLDAMEKEELALSQLQNFVRNTPKGKSGEALWDEFHKRKSKSRDKNYGIATFIKQVLVDAGFLIEP